MSSYVIVGNGAAGVTAAETVRQQDPGGEITIVGKEPYPIYSRPGLAYVLTSDIPAQQIYARSPEWYTHFRIQFVHGRANRLDTIYQKLFLADGRILRYDRLLIATG
ncbi:MAG: FAD-dependent oxidoreductase, partial [Anaerolineae bacterium]